MVISQSRLALLYGCACLLGMGLGLFWDALRILRIFFGEHFSAVANRFREAKLPLIEMKMERKKHKKLLAAVIFAEDFLFCMVAAVSMILLFYQINNGKLRFLAFPVAGVGFYLYRITLGRLVMLCSETAAFVLEAAVKYVVFFVLFPWKWLWNRIILAVKRFWLKRVEKKRKQDRVQFTKRQEAHLEQTVGHELLGEEVRKGVRQNVGKTKKAVQLESVGQDLSGGHRGGIHRRIRQQRHEV